MLGTSFLTHTTTVMTQTTLHPFRTIALGVPSHRLGITFVIMIMIMIMVVVVVALIRQVRTPISIRHQLRQHIT